MHSQRNIFNLLLLGGLKKKLYSLLFLESISGKKKTQLLFLKKLELYSIFTKITPNTLLILSLKIIVTNLTN